MKYKPYSTALWTRIHETLKKVCDENPHPLAAFDADGTLWDTDLGENFFQYQIDHKLVNLPQDPWDHYLNLKKENGDPRKAYLWLAQINQDQKLSVVRQWAQSAFESILPNPIFDEQQKLIELFLSKGVQIKIITASIKWAVEPGALALGLKPEDVLGVQTLVENDLISKEPVFPVTYREGKVQALSTQHGLPFFSCGNSIGDFELLKSATELSLAVSAAARDEKLFRTEVELQKAMHDDSKFMFHRFI